MLDYYYKYLKYKRKYLELKNNLNLNINLNDLSIQYGGRPKTKNKVKIFDLNSSTNSHYKKGNLQENLDDFSKTYGSKFKLKYGKILIDIVLNIAHLPNKLKFYRMIYDIPYRTTSLKPFAIDFIDPNLVCLNNNTYISNIQRTENISGTQMIKICLAINRILGAEKTYLSDGTTITCEKTTEKFDLSFLKLIERRSTFYTNLGFDFDIDKVGWFYTKFDSKEDLKKQINILINKIRSIKTDFLIKEYKKTMDLIIKIIKNNFKGDIQIILDNSNTTHIDQYYTETKNLENSLMEILTESKEMLGILNKYSKKYPYMYKILIDTFKNDCTEYSILNKYLIKNNRSKIIYNGKIINRPYNRSFKILNIYRYGYYSYKF
jgi:hypothetical protein